MSMLDLELTTGPCGSYTGGVSFINSKSFYYYMDKMSWLELKDGSFIRMKNNKPFGNREEDTLKRIGVKDDSPIWSRD